MHQYRILPDKDMRISVQSEGDMQPPSYPDLPSLVTSYIGKGDKNGLVCSLRRPVGPEGGPEVAEPDSGVYVLYRYLRKINCSYSSIITYTIFAAAARKPLLI